MPGVDPQIKQYRLVITGFQVLVSAFVAPVELFAPPDADASVQVAKHRRLLVC